MKNLLFYVTIGLAATVIAACSHQEKSHDGKEESGEWPEMDAFHMTMAEAYHPFKDSADLKPAKKLAGQLASEAETLAASKRPEKFDTDEAEAALTKLRTDAKTFADHVRAGIPDSDLGKELTAFHERFHEVMEHAHGK